jgi:hypothetical protein
VSEVPDFLSEESILKRAREALASRTENADAVERMRLKIGRRTTARRSRDGQVVSYSVRILIDPEEHEGRWVAQRVLYMYFDANGEPLTLDVEHPT